MPPNRFTFSNAGEPRFTSSESHRRLPPSSTVVVFSKESIHRSHRNLIQSHQPLDYEHPEPPSRFLHSFIFNVREFHRSIRELIQQTKADKQRKPQTKVKITPDSNRDQTPTDQKPATRSFNSLLPPES